MTPIKFKKTIALVDDHFLFRKGIKALLQEYKHIDVLFEAENGKELIEKLKVRQPDVILLDIEMPEMNGMEATEIVREKYPHVKIIILTSYYEQELAFKLMEKGVNAFLSKNTKTEEIIKAINSVISEGYYFDYEVSVALAKGLSVTRKIIPDKNAPKLSKRELEVVKLICNQHTNREIATIMCLSPRTIDTYRESIFQKTGAKNSVGVALFAFTHRLI
ncbi:MAG: response regulator transcription factor [Bacteroidetes bacterium]|nr:response regulator transcription factor [Bacteroidota bacterium]